MKASTLFFVLLSSLVLSGCETYKQESTFNANAIQPDTVGPALDEVVDLKNKSFSEIMKLKYEKAELTCSLLVYLGKKSNPIKTFERKVFILDLKKSDYVGTEYNLENAIFDFADDGKASFHQFKSTVRIIGMETGSFRIENTKLNKTFILEYSPLVKLEFRSKTLTVPPSLTPDPIADIIYQTIIPRSSIYEMMTTSVYNDVLDLNSEIETQDRLECSIETKIFPKYSGQFNVY